MKSSRVALLATIGGMILSLGLGAPQAQSGCRGTDPASPSCLPRPSSSSRPRTPVPETPQPTPPPPAPTPVPAARAVAPRRVPATIVTPAPIPVEVTPVPTITPSPETPEILLNAPVESPDTAELAVQGSRRSSSGWAFLVSGLILGVVIDRVVLSLRKKRTKQRLFG